MNLAAYTIDAASTLLDAAAKMNANRARTVLLVEDGKLTGLISEGDVMRALLRGVDTTTLALSAVNRSFRFLTSRDEATAFQWFQAHAFGLVPVVDADFRLVDVITIEQVLAGAAWPGLSGGTTGDAPDTARAADADA